MFDLLFFFFKQKTAYEMLRSLVGSEMCIRDSASIAEAGVLGNVAGPPAPPYLGGTRPWHTISRERLSNGYTYERPKEAEVLLKAIQEGDEVVVRKILDQSPGLLHMVTRPGRPPCHPPIHPANSVAHKRYGHINMPEEAIASSMTPLDLAIHYEQQGVARMLLEAGAKRQPSHMRLAGDKGNHQMMALLKAHSYPDFPRQHATCFTYRQATDRCDYERLCRMDREAPGWNPVDHWVRRHV
eukprot:TRINITY_DN30611_c0_g1_i2.p1 TRINITY_DN30611_c0_g1~~TRINITY_DN30611_c0_g1_i2.p1  ORF type:complete len:241 (-),score=51.87 TRINITY_DN30611_c0_g1_i2:104-826(-)